MDWYIDRLNFDDWGKDKNYFNTIYLCSDT
jgi:hypothetical protein